MKRVIVVLGDGFEEIEAVTPIDVLRRAGCEVVTAGMGKLEVTGSHGIMVKTDVLFEPMSGLYDAVVVPGGPGSDKLGQSEALKAFLVKMDKAKKIIGAICAAPAVVLAKAGILDGKKATCFPGCEEHFGPKTVSLKDRVVRDGHIITSRGAGTALEFAFELVRALEGNEKAAEVSERMVATK